MKMVAGELEKYRGSLDVFMLVRLMTNWNYRRDEGYSTGISLWNWNLTEMGKLGIGNDS